MQCIGSPDVISALWHWMTLLVCFVELIVFSKCLTAGNHKHSPVHCSMLIGILRKDAHHAQRCASHVSDDGAAGRQQRFAMLAVGCKAGVVWLWRFRVPSPYSPSGHLSPEQFTLVPNAPHPLRACFIACSCWWLPLVSCVATVPPRTGNHLGSRG